MRYKVIAEHSVTFAVFVEARNEDDAKNKVLLNEFDGESASLVEEGERKIISVKAEKEKTFRQTLLRLI